jgi:hypothetical protein
MNQQLKKHTKRSAAPKLGKRSWRNRSKDCQETLGQRIRRPRRRNFAASRRKTRQSLPTVHFRKRRSRRKWMRSSAPKNGTQRMERRGEDVMCAVKAHEGIRCERPGCCCEGVGVVEIENRILTWTTLPRRPSC